MYKVKYKVWCEYHGTWEPDTIRLSLDGSMIHVKKGMEMLANSKTHKLVLFSGLPDSKGTEIYAGDVVPLAGHGNYICEFPFIPLYEAHGEGDIGEIIGNVYENPELAKEPVCPECGIEVNVKGVTLAVEDVKYFCNNCKEDITGYILGELKTVAEYILRERNEGLKDILTDTPIEKLQKGG